MKPSIVLDTNIVLDLLANREPWSQEAIQLLLMANEEKVTAHLAAHTVTDIAHILTRTYKQSRGEASKRIEMILDVFKVVPETRDDFLQATTHPIEDLEDALVDICAQKIEADYVITRDKDFKKATTTVLTPKEFLAQFNN